ncbi:MAG: NADH-ubiquinone oxidoreductase chain I [uncultured Propionibacteriaceae bacterium]|uniref:NADH-ubiquinone oxidoreductase chain I n=1 Tax=uncultured Propionibacteriaceae bacterium TaxID=257457 RepID=A0A6J4N235_9ACTN|nr:MAG: NADH-ubiquinone oxidoreductase chain I [uncultured Propionibacteriaceae bacterium]
MTVPGPTTHGSNGYGLNGDGSNGHGSNGHGSIILIESNCTSCMICARECPTWCITIDSHTETVENLPAGARSRTENALDRFAIDWSLCMFCGICVEECPFDALEWSSGQALPGQTLTALTAEIADLTRQPGD